MPAYRLNRWPGAFHPCIIDMEITQLQKAFQVESQGTLCEGGQQPISGKVLLMQMLTSLVAERNVT